MLTVEVELGRGLARLLPDQRESKTMRVPSGTRIRQLVDLLGLPQGSVSVVDRNGVLATKDEQLSDGDRLRLYPPIGGG